MDKQHNIKYLFSIFKSNFDLLLHRVGHT